MCTTHDHWNGLIVVSWWGKDSWQWWQGGPSQSRKILVSIPGVHSLTSWHPRARCPTRLPTAWWHESVFSVGRFGWNCLHKDWIYNGSAHSPLFYSAGPGLQPSLPTGIRSTSSPNPCTSPASRPYTCISSSSRPNTCMRTWKRRVRSQQPTLSHAVTAPLLKFIITPLMEYTLFTGACIWALSRCFYPKRLTIFVIKSEKK